jgi:hypothetical protein
MNCISSDYVNIINNTPHSKCGARSNHLRRSTLLLPNTPSIGTGSWSYSVQVRLLFGNTVTKLAPDQNVLRYSITNKTCQSNDDVTITNNKPTTPNAGYDKNICTDQLILDGNIPTQGTGNWTVISGSGTFTDANNSKTVVSDLALGTNIYRWTITKNSCTEHDEVTIQNNYIASSAGGDVELCQDYYQMQAANPSPGKGLWTIIGSSGATFDKQTDPATTIRDLSKGINRLCWTVTNAGCISKDTVIVANYQPSDAFAGEDQSVCATSTTLNANVPTYGNGTWLVMSGTANFTNNSNAKTKVTQLGVGANRLRWLISQHSCESYDEVVITVISR